MGVVRLAPQVQLFCALLCTPEVAQQEIEQTLQDHFGAIVLRSTAFPFTQTTYYSHKMGPGLIRSYVAFGPLITPAALPAIKHTTNRIESEWSRPSGPRRVNLDPGYLDLGKVVLASTKDHAHRVYVGAGIYAEVTLRYRRRQFQPWDWTYPDYRLPETCGFFDRLRERYKIDLRSRSQAPGTPWP